MKFAILLAAAVSMTAQVTAQAHTADHGAHAHAAAPAASAATAVQAEGEVRKLDPAGGKMTLRHGPIASLAMPAMTMSFRVAEPRFFEGLAVGDKVRFATRRIDGAYTVTAIEVLK
jgi:Cu(I)/Ag(I) efflux system protein CusF